MFLNLNHYNLDVYKSARSLRWECYKILPKLPDCERFNLVDQIRRASTSVVLNITEGCSRKSVYFIKWNVEMKNEITNG